MKTRYHSGVQKPQRIIELLFALGVFCSFLGSYFSVSLIGLGTGLVLIFGIWNTIYYRQGSLIRQNPLFFPLCLLILSILVSILCASPYAYSKPLGKLRYLVCFFLFTVYFLKNPLAKEKITKLGLGISLFLGVIAVLQHLGIFSPLALVSGLKPSPIPDVPNRFLATGFAFHHNPFGATMNLLCPVMLAHALFSPKGQQKLWFSVAAAFCSVAIVCSFSRSSWLAFAVSTGFLLFLSRPRLALGFLASLGGAVFSLFLFYEPFRARVGQFTIAANSERLELWRICWEMFKDSPWVGHGFYSFGTHFKKYTELHESIPNFPVEAHNMYLDLLSGTGLIGVSAFIYFIISVFILLGRALKKTEGSWTEKSWILGGMAGFGAFLVGGIFDKLFYMTQTIVPVLFFLAIATSVVMLQKQKQNLKKPKLV